MARGYRWNPHRLSSLSDPKKTDVLAPPIPLTADRYISKTLCALNFGVIEEWESTEPFLIIKTTEEWTFAAPSMATLATEEWELIVLGENTATENWNYTSATFTQQIHEAWN